MQTSNLVYTHPGQNQMQVEVILASATDTGSPPIYTIRMRYPRPFHGEIMTHRVFGLFNDNTETLQKARMYLQQSAS